MGHVTGPHRVALPRQRVRIDGDRRCIPEAGRREQHALFLLPAVVGIEVAAAFAERYAALLEIIECGEARAQARTLRQCPEIGLRQARFPAPPGTGCGGIEVLEPSL